LVCQRTSAWHCGVEDGVIRVERGELAGAQFKVEGDFALMRSDAKLTRRDNPAGDVDARSLLRSGFRAGLIKTHGDFSSLPAFMDVVHDRMALVTR
jgi:hypothetical protein